MAAARLSTYSLDVSALRKVNRFGPLGPVLLNTCLAIYTVTLSWWCAITSCSEAGPSQLSFAGVQMYTIASTCSVSVPLQRQASSREASKGKTRT
jgi:hypothetical protein